MKTTLLYSCWSLLGSRAEAASTDCGWASTCSRVPAQPLFQPKLVHSWLFQAHRGPRPEARGPGWEVLTGSHRHSEQSPEEAVGGGESQCGLWQTLLTPQQHSIMALTFQRGEGTEGPPAASGRSVVAGS